MKTSKNDLGEYWQSYCLICLGDVYSFKVFDAHFLFQDDLKALTGRPICKGCYNDLKDKIPDHIDVTKKNEIEREKNFTERIFENIEKTHQAPCCKICGLLFPRLNQKTMICKSCKKNNKMKYKKIQDYF